MQRRANGKENRDLDVVKDSSGSHNYFGWYRVSGHQECSVPVSVTRESLRVPLISCHRELSFLRPVFESRLLDRLIQLLLHRTSKLIPHHHQHVLHRPRRPPIYWNFPSLASFPIVAAMSHRHRRHVSNRARHLGFFPGTSDLRQMILRVLSQCSPPRCLSRVATMPHESTSICQR